MADRSAGIETSAISLLTRAIELDGAKRFTEALVCYQEGIQLLLDVIKASSQETKKQRFRDKIKEYMARAEEIKKHIEKEKADGHYHEQIHIQSDSIGHSYQSLLGRFMNDSLLTRVEIEDPYIRSVHQIYNLLRFCELVVKSTNSVKEITVKTSSDSSPESKQQQISKLDMLANSLRTNKIQMTLDFSSTLHDREIRLDTGWIIKIGRGLDYFKATNKFSIGYCDLDLRPCHETTVDVFHKSFTKRASLSS